MPDHLTVDVIDRPAEGVARALRRLLALRRREVRGLRALIPLGTARFVPRKVPAFTLRRVGMLAAWEDEERAEEAWERLLAPLAAGAREHWHVRGEVTRAAFTEPWRGWIPATEGARPLSGDESALILISGDLHARFVPAFAVDAGRAVGQAQGEPGYLGGLGIASSPLNTTSCSAWRTYDDARCYAFASGRHAEAMRRDRAAGHHRTEWFLRVRPLGERGTLAGSAPFAGLVPVAGRRAVA